MLRFIGLSMLAVMVLSGAVQAEEKAPPAAMPTAELPTPSAPSAEPPPASFAPASEAMRVALQQRAERYWAARQSRDIRTIYELESAAQPGGWLKLENAMSLQGLPLRNVKVGELQIEGDKAAIQVKADVLIGTMGWAPQTIKDSWIRINDQWYHETTRP
ncbi:MAG TPA: hypothetical protein DCS21_07270 [Gammaproteobacteria bacterium]|nr:hypothetical protein [Gammaproteobacteria bacterium]